MALTTAHVDN